MYVDAMTCDAVTVREGLLHVLGGGVSHLNRPSLPAVLGINVAAVLSGEAPVGLNTFNISVVVRAPDVDQPIRTVAGQIHATKIVPEDDLVVPFSIFLADTELPGPGKYSIELSVDNVVLRTLWVRVMPVTIA